MKTFKTMALIGASALAVSAISTAAVQAQPWHGDRYGYDRDRDHDGYRGAYVDPRLTTANIDRLSSRLYAEARNGEMSWNQVYHLRADLNAVRPLAVRAQIGRANGWEIRRLSDTVTRVEAESSRYAANDRYRTHDWRR